MDFLVADAVWPNRSAAGGGGFRARRFTSICEITETIGARMDSEAPRLRLGNEDLQSVSTDAKREESRKSREANEKPPRSFREVSRQRSEGAAVSEEWAQPPNRQGQAPRRSQAFSKGTGLRRAVLCRHELTTVSVDYQWFWCSRGAPDSPFWIVKTYIMQSFNADMDSVKWRFWALDRAVERAVVAY